MTGAGWRVQEEKVRLRQRQRQSVALSLSKWQRKKSGSGSTTLTNLEIVGSILLGVGAYTVIISGSEEHRLPRLLPVGRGGVFWVCNSIESIDLIVCLSLIKILINNKIKIGFSMFRHFFE